MKDRAYRRHHNARMLRRAKRKLTEWGGTEWAEIAAARWANNMAKCSCYMCGNPRRHFNQLTFQEQRSKLLERDYYENNY